MHERQKLEEKKAEMHKHAGMCMRHMNSCMHSCMR